LQTLFFIAFGELVVCWVLWVLVFARRQRQPSGQRPVVTARTARWGILLQGISYGLVWSFSTPPTGLWAAPLIGISMVLAPASVLLAFFAVRHLGKQWRIQAGLNEDHELVQTGPYRWVRHPIYASMLALFLATGALLTRWPVFLVALALILAGTEIRVRVEDGLLAGRFGEAFRSYKSRVRAYIPVVR
jgi:protein-S-isoprenylcysteine O-methyltransferase Ste14